MFYKYHKLEKKTRDFQLRWLTPFFCTFFGRKHGALHKYFIYTTGWITWTLPLWKLIGNFQNSKPNFNQNHAKNLNQKMVPFTKKKGGVHCAGSFLSTWDFSRFSKRKLLLFRRGFFEKTPGASLEAPKCCTSRNRRLMTWLGEDVLRWTSHVLCLNVLK